MSLYITAALRSQLQVLRHLRHYSAIDKRADENSNCQDSWWPLFKASYERAWEALLPLNTVAKIVSMPCNYKGIRCINLGKMWYVIFKHKTTFRKRRIYTFRAKSGEEKSDTGRMGQGKTQTNNNKHHRWKTKLKKARFFLNLKIKKECAKTEFKKLKEDLLYERVSRQGHTLQSSLR